MIKDSLVVERSKNDIRNSEIRERIQAYGVSCLLNKESISFLCDIDIKKLDSIETFEDLRNIYMLLPITDLQKQKIEALFNLSIRITTEKASENAIIKSPEDCAELLMEEMRHLKREEFRIVMLNTKNKVIKISTISTGDLVSCIVPIQNILHECIINTCKSIIAVHAHPSGDPVESQEDISLTNLLNKACQIINIKLLDHIIIGDGRFTSFKEKGLL